MQKGSDGIVPHNAQASEFRYSSQCLLLQKQVIENIFALRNSCSKISCVIYWAGFEIIKTFCQFPHSDLKAKCGVVERYVFK